jgi:putative tRNA adenosine deaminase-associated protein
VGDEFFVALRVIGERTDVFLSDITASWDFPLAQQVLDYLDIPVPDEEELDEILQDEETVLPAGDLSIFADLGLDEMELGILSGDIDLMPEDVLSSIAARLGFSEPFERAIESVFG